jgi:hypothetical protein
MHANASSTSALPVRFRLFSPLVILLKILVSLAFFTDGALDGYMAFYLRMIFGSSALLRGVGIAAFHFIRMLGRLDITVLIPPSQRALERARVSASSLF